MFGFVCVVVLSLTPNTCRLLYAQTGFATLSGQITDSSGRVVPGVSIVLTNLNTNVPYSTASNNDGIYNLAALPPGIYRANLSKDGFKSIVKGEIELHTQDNVSLNFSLQVGSVSETITVSANRDHLETDSPAVGILVDHTFVENMPLNGRSFQDLITLAPGTVTGVWGNYNINGQRENANSFTVDGVSANVSPDNTPQDLSGTLPARTALGTTQSLLSIDALQEFKIQTSGYSAEYGRQPGGQIEFTSRSGSNDLHGSLFDYFRNEALDANSWFANQQGIPRQAERQNDFGGTFSGPIVKDRTFFFFSYEGLRLHVPRVNGPYNVPTPEFRAFASPSIQPFFQALPLPNVRGHLTNGDSCAVSANAADTFSCTGEWESGGSNPSDLDSFGIRIDHTFNSIIQVFGRYAGTFSDLGTINFGVPGERTNFSSSLNTVTLGSAVRIHSNLVDEIRFNYSFAKSTSTQQVVAIDGSVPYSRSLVFPQEYVAGGAVATDQVDPSLPDLAYLNIPGYGKSTNQQQQYNLVDSLSWSRKNHTLKFGVDYRRLLPVLNLGQYESIFNFQSATSIQQGSADSVFIIAQHEAHPTFDNLSLYAEDHWQISSRLTLDYGLRWEFNPAPGATDGAYPLALTTSDVLTAQIAPRGTPQYHNVYHNFAPRFGFAYSVFHSSVRPLVIRAGAGIFYDTGQAEAAAGYSGYPFEAFNTLANVPLPASQTILTPPSLNVPIVPPFSLNGVTDPNLKLPYTEEWNVSVDKGLTSQDTLTASYVGNSGKRLLFTQNYQATLNPNFTFLNLINNAGGSRYNALQIQNSGNLAPNVQILASYTFAHAIDNVSTDTIGYANIPTWGNSDNDVRQAFNLALNVTIPRSERGGFVDRLVHGWSFANRFAAQSGFPIEVFQGYYLLPNGTQQFIRPDLVKSVPIYLHNVEDALGHWAINSAAFNLVPTDSNGVPLRTGTLGRNYIHGPNFWALNSALQRSFGLGERMQLNLRAEAFNILNHPNAGSIDSFLLDPTFGQALSLQTVGASNPAYATGSPRSLQISLRLAF